MLITLYGINNIGKSTHTKLLVDRLIKEGHDAIYLKYPIYDQEPTGPYLNEILRSGKQQITEEELQMWFALNRYQFQPKLQEYLDKGITVVAEDYTGTALAWGAAKGANHDWLESINEPLIKEDLAILIDGERAAHAIEDDHIHENDHDLIAKVRQNLLELAQEHNWQKIDLQAKKTDTHALIWQEVKKHLQA